MVAKMRAGDWVEVRNAESILNTLDSTSALDKMPFMPEMLQFCGKRFRISKVAHKTCDVAFKTGGRSLDDTYHLEDLRCDGSAHGGCQATCLLFWKGAWLRKIDNANVEVSDEAEKTKPLGTTINCTLDQVSAATRAPDSSDGGARYSCQATKLVDATRLLPWWDVRQYFRDLSSGNVSFTEFIRVIGLSWLRALNRLPIGYRATYRLYDCIHTLMVGYEPPGSGGLVPDGVKTPLSPLGLQPGDVVIVKSHNEIRHTLNSQNRNRGLWFDQEYVEYCGTKQQVTHQVERILDERTGEMLEMKTPCFVLAGVNCRARYSRGRLFCPRAITAYWRESWLERVPPTDSK